MTAPVYCEIQPCGITIGIRCESGKCYCYLHADERAKDDPIVEEPVFLKPFGTRGKE